MSRRIYETLLDLVPVVEPYSIDEMFLDLAGMPGDLAQLAADIRSHVRKIAKIPCCVGIGPTKTIAKLANRQAKKDRNGPGVVDYSDATVRALACPDIPLGDVWGIGPASVAKLRERGVETVGQFIAIPADRVRQILTVTGAKTHTELGGVICFPFNTAPAMRKSLAVIRSFGKSQAIGWHPLTPHQRAPRGRSPRTQRPRRRPNATLCERLHLSRRSFARTGSRGRNPDALNPAAAHRIRRRYQQQCQQIAICDRVRFRFR